MAAPTKPVKAAKLIQLVRVMKEKNEARQKAIEARQKAVEDRRRSIDDEHWAPIAADIDEDIRMILLDGGCPTTSNGLPMRPHDDCRICDENIAFRCRCRELGLLFLIS